MFAEALEIKEEILLGEKKICLTVLAAIA